MQLRSHPMMVYGGRPNWPPQWNWISGPGNTESAAVGEAGALEHVQPSHVPGNTIFLTIEMSDGNRFTGQLAFDDDHFAREVLSVLHAHLGHTVKDIAELDIA
jgi:hypothetical protein